jgi:hypothetical protein
MSTLNYGQLVVMVGVQVGMSANMNVNTNVNVNAKVLCGYMMSLMDTDALSVLCNARAHAPPPDEDECL